MTATTPRSSTTPDSHAVNRHSERARTARDELYEVLDAIPFGTLSTVVDGRPWVVPMLFARDGDRLILHGSTGAGALRQVAAGAPAALSVAALDGIVVAASTFNSSANYRSAVVHGTLQPLTDTDAKSSALEYLSNRLIPGRTAEVRPMTGRELAATLAMTLEITDDGWTVKIRTGDPTDEESDSPAWQGVVPLHTTAQAAQPAAWVPAERPIPASVRRLLEQ